jgi:ribosome biogenesis GTPase
MITDGDRISNEHERMSSKTGPQVIALVSGTIIRIDARESQVATAEGILSCVIRGRLTASKGPDKRLLAVGDEVRVRSLGPERGAIEEILPRRTKLSRQAAGVDRREQVVAANIDQVVIVSSLADPPLNLNLVDRYLVAAGRGGLGAVICINKVDLGDRAPVRAMLGPYDALRIPIVWTSVRDGTGIDALRDRLAGHKSVFAGKSGVGKSALLNAVEPGLELRSGEISSATGKGRHTTTYSSLLPLAGGGFVIDTPGIRSYTLWEVDPEGLDRHFPEIQAQRGGCRFGNCTHSHEPDCAVKDAVAAGKIEERRYTSYLRILSGLDEE